MSNLIDSHAHADLCGEPAVALAEAREHGVSRILTVGFDLESSRRAAALAKNHADMVSAAVGIHPNDVAVAGPEAMAELAQLAAQPGVVAIGETGLDYYRDRSPRSAQKEWFLKHIELARATGLTLIVHAREANDDTLDILENHAGDLRVVLHCFSLYEHIDRCAGHRFFMSVAGNVTFPKAEDLREAASKIPDELVLSETDCPWLTPVPYRGKPNQPAYVRFVVEELARLRGTTPAGMAGQIYANFRAAFPACA